MTTKPNNLRIGTRRSALAKTQTNQVAAHLSKLYPELKIDIIEIVTTGDKVLNTALNQMPGKGVFVKEIEEKLLAGDIDMAVHSMKDLPTEFPEGLKIGAVTTRVDPRDVFVSRLGLTLGEMPAGARIGTSSLRRQAQLLKFRDDLEIVDIRGNIDTRLRKSESDPYDGIVLAAAGLIRMGWQERIHEYISCDVMIPAVGQGAVGIEIREHDKDTADLIAPLNDVATELSVKAERIFLDGMGGGCHAPMGAYCNNKNGHVVLKAFKAEADGSQFQRAELQGQLSEAAGLAHRIVETFQHRL